MEYSDTEKNVIIWKPYICLCICIAIFLFHASNFLYFTQDDAFISFRYVKNLVQGYGLVYNPGERVEGYSNFLWVLLLALFNKLGLELLQISKVMGLLSGITVFVLLYRLGTLITGRRTITNLLSVFLLSVSPCFALWSVAGLETLFYTLLLISALSLFILEEKRNYKLPLSSVLFAMTAITRPEGIIFFVGSLGWRLWHSWHIRKIEKHDLLWFSFFFVIYGTFLIWKYCYYGSILPNTYYAKVGRRWLEPLRGIKYIYEFCKSYGGIVLYFMPIGILLSKKVIKEYKYLFLVICLQLIFIVYVGGDQMGQFRFIVPILPIIYFLIQEGLVNLSFALNGEIELREPIALSRLLKKMLVLLMLSLTVFLSIWTYFFFNPQFRDIATENTTIGDSRDLVKIGEWLKDIAPKNSTLAVGEAGAIPYVTEMPTIDLFGLCDKTIANAPKERDHRGVPQRDRTYVINYLIQRRPTFVEFFQGRNFDTVFGYGSSILLDSLIANSYQLIPPYDRIPGIVILGTNEVIEAMKK